MVAPPDPPQGERENETWAQPPAIWPQRTGSLKPGLEEPEPALLFLASGQAAARATRQRATQVPLHSPQARPDCGSSARLRTADQQLPTKLHLDLAGMYGHAPGRPEGEICDGQLISPCFQRLQEAVDLIVIHHQARAERELRKSGNTQGSFRPLEAKLEGRRMARFGPESLEKGVRILLGRNLRRKRLYPLLEISGCRLFGLTFKKRDLQSLMLFRQLPEIGSSITEARQSDYSQNPDCTAGQNDRKGMLSVRNRD
jgi:hypothetical protein